MKYLGDYKKNAVVQFNWSTNDGDGGAVAPSVAGSLRVYKDDGTTQVAVPTGITDTRAFDGVTGLQQCKIDLSANSFYEKNKDYSVVLVGATIDSQTVNAVIATFSIEKRHSDSPFIPGG